MRNYALIFIVLFAFGCTKTSSLHFPIEKSHITDKTTKAQAPNPEDTNPFPENLHFDCDEGANSGYPITGYWDFVTCEVELCIEEENCHTIDCIGNENGSNFDWNFTTDGKFTFIAYNPDYEYCSGLMFIYLENHGILKAESQIVEEGNGGMNTLNAIFDQQAANYIDNSLGLYFAYGAD